MNRAEPLIAPRFLFRFALPVRHRGPIWDRSGAELTEQYCLPDLVQLDAERRFAEFRMGWDERGVAFSVRVAGKTQPAWCRETRLEDSDGVEIWIDTRSAHSVHRATRFCHRFVFLPAGAGRKHDEPVADQLLIARARENAPPIRPGQLQIVRVWTEDGYQLDGFVPAAALVGYEPREHPRLGFNYAVFDRELGLQTLSTGTGFPYQTDPSTWATLELVPEEKKGT